MAKSRLSKRLRNIIVPKNNKHKKPYKKLLKNIKINYKNSCLFYGLTGLKLLKSKVLLPNQIETIRLTFNKIIKKKTRFWNRLKPQIAGTSKPENIRMGKGKGAVNYWKNYAYSGTILFEYTFTNIQFVNTALYRAKKYLPIPSILTYKKMQNKYFKTLH